MTAFHVMAGARGEFARPEVRKIGIADIVDALRLGLADFKEKPSHYVFLCLMYPIAGVFLVMWSSGANLLPLIYPLMSGFALIGPLAAIGLYEISRRREQGMDSSWRYALEVRHSPAMPSIIAVGLMLFALFIVWLIVAQSLYTSTFDATGPISLSTFLSDVLTTPQGLSLIIWGNLAGFVFAVIVLATTVVAFPLLLDRDVGAVAAVDASIRATLANPVPVALWGLIVAALLVVGTIPVFVGLAVIMPVLGHATWHLYRKLIVPVYPSRMP
ncbi:DUF2189 domain-containing protein [Agrobacterium genomosp. 3]|uniref:Cytochrome c oxidase subunit I n=1 Tax=Agrobacterium tomkonis CFBP 6623 TaxID=1183432 RepID=A0A1S7S2V1_9HYPH|nr:MULTISPECIES: DUF2189 domain-containing protein [Agrobacterium tumefaciens complex]MBP8937127.1 DUF2189 domain-containing protein [Agrobacterium sp.]MCA1868561.1 DUF2189 domain-containing protein [Agrobacterium tomkonis]MCA1878910.1 DUF2189 domain-containing protein [Agrobacterium tumefaciens]MCA1894169.1 DUF2189 domain-containing protein [Agrobacterium tomkonis]QCL92301.1 DUF2189 domain-containing protein [Agrobacterium tumefaciens]